MGPEMIEQYIALILILTDHQSLGNPDIEEISKWLIDELESE